MTFHRVGLIASVVAISGSLFAGSATAHAAPIVGTGLIRFDATWATVKTLSDGTSVITLNKEASGEWMGEIGRSLVPGVRDLDDRDLVTVWENVGHRSGVGVDATVTWDSLAHAERVELSDPRLTPRGHLRFVVDADQELPARISNVTLNLARASGISARSFPLNETYSFTATTTATTTIPIPLNSQIAIRDSGLTCYEYTLIQSAPSLTLPASLTCNSVVFNNSTSSMSVPSPTEEGDVIFQSTITASGDSFQFSAIIASWSQSGS